MSLRVARVVIWGAFSATVNPRPEEVQRGSLSSMSRMDMAKVEVMQFSEADPEPPSSHADTISSLLDTAKIEVTNIQYNSHKLTECSSIKNVILKPELVPIYHKNLYAIYIFVQIST